MGPSWEDAVHVPWQIVGGVVHDLFRGNRWVSAIGCFPASGSWRVLMSAAEPGPSAGAGRRRLLRSQRGHNRLVVLDDLVIAAVRADGCQHDAGHREREEGE